MDTLRHAYDVTISAGTDNFWFDQMYAAEEAFELSNTYGTFGTYGSAFGTFGTLGTYGSCCS